jgi:trehalose 6-phosphate phosphatase
MERLREAPKKSWLLIFDFDGTLSAIAPRPEDARLDPELLTILQSVQAEVRALAVVSGRGRTSLARLLPADWHAIGSYGLELPREFERSGLAPGFDAVAARNALDAARPVVEAWLEQWPGGRLENKTFGLALHFRGAAAAPDLETAHAAFDALPGLRLHPGRLVYELRPDTDIDKGWATRYLLDRVRPSAAVFVGDDYGDVPAWEALLDAGKDTVCLNVGVASEETPAEALKLCDVVLEGRAGLKQFAERLARA